MIDTEYIINAPIIPAEIDAFWQADRGFQPEPIAGAQLLILTVPLKEEDQVSLDKMMSACQKEPGSYIVFEMDTEKKIPWFHLRNTYLPASVMLLGILPAQLGISAMFRLNWPNTFDQRIWIPSLSLDQLSRDPHQKKALWVQALKPLFAQPKAEED